MQHMLNIITERTRRQCWRAKASHPKGSSIDGGLGDDRLAAGMGRKAGGLVQLGGLAWNKRDQGRGWVKKKGASPSVLAVIGEEAEAGRGGAMAAGHCNGWYHLRSRLIGSRRHTFPLRCSLNSKKLCLKIIDRFRSRNKLRCDSTSSTLTGGSFRPNSHRTLLAILSISRCVIPSKIASRTRT